MNEGLLEKEERSAERSGVGEGEEGGGRRRGGEGKLEGSKRKTGREH